MQGVLPKHSLFCGSFIFAFYLQVQPGENEQSDITFEQSDITFTVISPCLPLVFTAENYQYMAKINILHPPCFWRVCSKIKSHENRQRTFFCCYQHSLKSRIQQGEGKQFRLERKKVQVHTEPCWETWDDTSRVKLTGIR